MRSFALVRAIGVALVLQLITAAGALAGPWAVGASAPAARAAAPSVDAPVIAEQPVAGEQTVAPVARQVALSALELWEGAVPLVPLGVDAGGELTVPATEAELGWWADGPAPGDEGAAVVVGHVDLDGRPGVLSRLASAVPGTVVVANRPEGNVPFVVTHVERYAKGAFPTDEVYRPVVRAELRLITCGGRFDRTSGQYEDNVIVTAVRVS